MTRNRTSDKVYKVVSLSVWDEVRLVVDEDNPALRDGFNMVANFVFDAMGVMSDAIHDTIDAMVKSK